jgi:parallel beta-helix repeat protein
VGPGPGVNDPGTGTFFAAQSANLFVSKTGSDANSCETVNQPCRTIGAAIAKVKAKAGGGPLMSSSISIRRGTYSEMPLLNVSGVVGNPLVIQAYNNESVILDGKNARGKSFRIKASNVLIKDLRVRFAKGSGITMSRSSNVKLINIETDHNAGSGVATSGGNGNEFQEVMAHSNVAGDGINIRSGKKHIVKDCKLFDNGDDGLDISGATESVIANNEASNNGKSPGTDGVGIDVGPGSGGKSKHRISRNRSHNNRGPGFQNTPGQGNAMIQNQSVGNIGGSGL